MSTTRTTLRWREKHNLGTMRADITQLLFDSKQGDQHAMDQLLAVVYDDLRRLARRQLLGESAELTLSATALVNEAWLRLLSQTGGVWNDRQHFFRVLARAMRRIAVDHARARLAQKRGGGLCKIELDPVDAADDRRAEMIVELEEAMEQLRTQDERLVQVVECRFFVGLTEAETATTLDCSRRTVQRSWEQAKQQLKSLLTS